MPFSIAMNTPLKSVLLIDDDPSVNFLHTFILKRCDCVQDIHAETTAVGALAYLQKKNNDAYPQPEMIFLDINMPGMNGWDFMHEYNNLPPEQRAKAVIVMLTTALPSDLEAQAAAIPNITAFWNKPIDAGLLKEFIGKHFGV